MALVVLSVVEQRLDAVRAVLAGMEVTEVAVRAGVHRATVHRWVGRYLAEQIGGLADRSHRPASCPHQAAEAVEVAVAEMRREHSRWGSRRIRLELLRRPLPWKDETLAVPSERTIDRILIRHQASPRYSNRFFAVSSTVTRRKRPAGSAGFSVCSIAVTIAPPSMRPASLPAAASCSGIGVTP